MEVDRIDSADGRGVGDGLFHFLADEVFAERGEEILRAPGEPDQRRVPLLERHRVAEQVRPQPRTRRDDHRVLHPDLHVRQRVPGREVAAELVHRDELEEDVVIRHHPEQLVPRVFGRDEPLRTRIHFAELHRVAADLLHEQVAERVELRAAVNHHSQVRPHFGHRLLARHFLEPPKQHEHPRRDTADRGDRLVGADFREPPHFRVPVGHQRKIKRRKGVRPEELEEFLRRDAAQVAREAPVGLLTEVGAAAEEKELAGEELRGRVHMPEQRGCGETRLLVRRHHLPAHRDELRRPAGGAGGERVVGNVPRPGDVVDPRVRVLPVGVPEPLVIANSHASLIIRDGRDAGEVVISPKARVPRNPLRTSFRSVRCCTAAASI